MSDDEYMDARSDAGKQISGDSKESGASYSHRSFRGQGKPAKPGERQKMQGKMTDADRNELAIRKSALKREAKEDDKKKGRCWTGYKPTPGKKPYSDGSCQKEGWEMEFYKNSLDQLAKRWNY